MCRPNYFESAKLHVGLLQLCSSLRFSDYCKSIEVRIGNSFRESQNLFLAKSTLVFQLHLSTLTNPLGGLSPQLYMHTHATCMWTPHTLYPFAPQGVHRPACRILLSPAAGALLICYSSSSVDQYPVREVDCAHLLSKSIQTASTGLKS